MNNNEFIKGVVIPIIIIVLAVILIVLISLAFNLNVSRQEVSVFCSQNGYGTGRLLDVDSGYCLKYSNNEKRYLSWDGDNWRFEK